MKKVKRIFKYLFVKRLAVTPYGLIGKAYGEYTDKWIFEWQKMPAGYRWF